MLNSIRITWLLFGDVICHEHSDPGGTRARRKKLEKFLKYLDDIIFLGKKYHRNLLLKIEVFIKF